MPLIELKIPAGFKQNGTDLESEGRWRDGNLVRWTEGSLRPIGGWTDRVVSTTIAAAPRGMLAWQDDSGDRWIASGTYDGLYVFNAITSYYNITPTSFTSGLEDAAVLTGYGSGTYGTGAYGAPREDTGNYSEATTWSLDTWGQYLIGCSSSDGKLYEWQLSTGTPAAAITNAPESNKAVVVTEERFIFALGAGGDPRKIAWCDFEDNTVWTAASTNQAGDVILQTPGQIMTGVRTQGQTLILTDQDAHRATYIGPPYVYQFERVGTSCGLVSRKAVANTSAGVFWMGQKSFFHFDGSQVRELPCEVWDSVFPNINPSQASKTWAITNGQYNEIWFYYVSDGSTEVDSYVAFNFKTGHWLLGSMSRTSGVDRGVFRAPIYSDSEGDIYNHETGFVYDGDQPYAESGPIRGNGDVLYVDRVIPDEASLGDVEITLLGRIYPTESDMTFGPYTVAQPTNTRAYGRQIRLRVDGAGSADWRLGYTRLNVMSGGQR